MSDTKIFIIGLPRTATTSLCVACLELGFKTAHTAYTKASFQQAQVIADTPIFSDYKILDAKYPNAKFIYLQRSLDTWIPSIKQLLARMSTNLLRSDGGFNPYLKRSYQEIFSPFTLDNINDDTFLANCYLRHQQGVMSYFKSKPASLLTIDIADNASFAQLLNFLNISPKDTHIKEFKPINIGGKVTAWNDIKHPNKVSSTHNGRIDKHLYE